MTLSEFKAWFEGFTESMAKAPNEAQWKRIKARVKEIDGTTVTERVFVDRYWPPYQRYFDYRPYWSTCGTVTTPTFYTQTAQTGIAMNASNAGNQIGSGGAAFATQTFSSNTAMADLGRAEARAIGA